MPPGNSAYVDVARLEALVQPVLAREAAELVDLQYLRERGRWVLRFFVDKAGGISLDDCERLSGSIGAVLEMENVVPGSYVLEVSSPGLDRVLKREADFVRFAGHRARIRLKSALEGQRNFRGLLLGCAEGRVSFESADRRFEFLLADIEEARLDPDIQI